MTDEALTLTPMGVRDIPDVLEIERVSFSNPWQYRDFEYALDQETGYARVCRSAGALLGYAIGFEAGDEFHLADFAVRPNAQRKGYGTRLLALLTEDLVSLDFRVVTLEVRRSNRPAVGLYGRAGFQTVAIRRGYYSRPVEDALVMVKPLSGTLSEWVQSSVSRLPETGKSD